MPMSLTRLSLAVAVFVLPFYGRIPFLSQAMYQVNFEQGKDDSGLAHNNVFLNLTQTPRAECFYRCSTDCRCLAFQMFKDTECQLLTSSRFGATLLRMPGYTYYDIIPSQTPGGCPNPAYCCQPNPCPNGDTCQPPDETEHGLIRFRCGCRRGFGGSRCEHRISCSAYLKISSSYRDNGLYRLDNPTTGEPFVVYCAFFDSERQNSFTLIQSYALQNVSQIKPFTTDAPINEGEFTWSAWRLSKANMEMLMTDASRKWIMTCDYNKHALKPKEDYLSVTIANFNFLKEDNANRKCIKADRFSVGGETCRNCDVPVTQTSLYPFHVITDSKGVCGLTVPKTSEGCQEDSFGWYQCKNTAHSCAASPESTTQTWIEL